VSSEKPFDPTAYWEERLSTRYTLGSTGWLSLGEGFNRWMYAVRRRAFTRFVRGVVDDPASLRVLDVGSGTGFYLDGWRELGARDITGCDLTSAAVEQLRAAFPELTVVQADIGDEAGQLPPGPYDAISIVDVLYHIVDDERYRRAFANLAGLLRPGGTLFFTENLVLSGRRVRHQVHRTRQTIEAIVSDAGLSVVGEQPFFFLMNDPVASNSRLLHGWWKVLSEAVVRHEAIGWSAGAVLFPVELGLTRVFRRGPSTTLLACRRR
jgi:SAM-dependent methyltransferase